MTGKKIFLVLHNTFLMNMQLEKILFTGEWTSIGHCPTQTILFFSSFLFFEAFTSYEIGLTELDNILMICSRIHAKLADEKRHLLEMVINVDERWWEICAGLGGGFLARWCRLVSLVIQVSVANLQPCGHSRLVDVLPGPHKSLQHWILGTPHSVDHCCSAFQSGPKYLSCYCGHL